MKCAIYQAEKDTGCFGEDVETACGFAYLVVLA